MFQKFNDMENFYNKMLNEKLEHQIVYVVWAQHFFLLNSHYSGKNQSGQLIEQLAVLYQEIRPKPNSAAPF